LQRLFVAFLNSKGGFLFIGIDDNGKAQGLDNDFKLSEGKKPATSFSLSLTKLYSTSLHLREELI
jgi:predicted HTH transcriptional regulator